MQRLALEARQRRRYGSAPRAMESSSVALRHPSGHGGRAQGADIGAGGPRGTPANQDLHLPLNAFSGGKTLCSARQGHHSQRSAIHLLNKREVDAVAAHELSHAELTNRATWMALMIAMLLCETPAREFVLLPGGLAVNRSLRRSSLGNARHWIMCASTCRTAIPIASGPTSNSSRTTGRSMK